MKIFLKFTVLFLLLTAAMGLYAQSSNGTIIGVVTDSQDAVVKDATLTAVSTQTGETHTAISNSQGAYRMESVSPGTYTVTVKAAGFTLTKMGNIVVAGSQTVTVNAALKVGGAETSVVVESAAELIHTDDGAISHNISSQEITSLPIASLNPIALVLTQPGVTAPTSREDFTNGIGFSVNGARPRSNNFLIEGQDNNDASINGQALQVTNLEATKEVDILTNSYSAEYGHGGGSVTNLIYKSGTNNWHGSVYDLIQNSSLNSADAADKVLGNAKAKSRENTYGFSLGGPIKKDKMFVFGSIQWDKTRQDANGDTLTVPTAAGVAVLQSLAPTSPNAARYLAALGGLVGNPDPAAAGFATLQLGNGRPAVTVGHVARTRVGEPSNDTQYVVKGDWLPSNRDIFTVRYVLDQNNLAPDFFNLPNQLPCCDTQQSGSAHNAGVAFTHTFSPHVINEFRASYGRIGFTFGPTAATLANPVAQGPAVAIGTGSGVVTGFGEPTGFPQSRFHNTFQYQDSVSWLKGNHTFKFGADMARIQVTDGIPFNNRGTLTYGSTTGFGALGNFVDDFGGNSSTAAAIAFGSPIIRPRYFYQNYFIQDTWKLRSNLTVNYGVRYENSGTPGNSVAFPAVDPVLGAADPNFFTTPIKQQNDTNNFAPRVGFAYTPHFWSGLFGDNKTVIRAGYGIYYDNLFTNIVDNTASTTPNSISSSLTSINNGPNQTARGLANLSGQLAAIQPVIDQSATVNSIVKNLKAPITHQWNFDIERELPGKFVVTTSYVGTRGIRLFGNDQFNPGDPNVLVGSGRVNPTRGSWVVRDNSVDSIYHAFDLKIDRRFSHGLLLRTAYTFSKLIDDGSEVFTTTGTSSFPSDLTLGNRGVDRGLSAFDHRHRIVVVGVYDIPKFRNDSNFAMKAFGQVVNGWQLSGTYSYQSGAPNTVSDGFDANGDFQANDRPLLGNPNAPLLTYAIDPNNFGAGGPGTPSGTLCDGPLFVNTNDPCHVVTANDVHWIIPANGAGNVGRNTFISPGRHDTTTGIQRTFNLHSDRQRLVVRTEMLNPFNHPNTGNTDYNLIGITPDVASAQTFGNYADTVKGARTIRFWLKYQF
jgi:carboxypeptidase family protein/TonB-dependent receptor-like protein